LANPTHAYSTSGVKTVSLTVTDSDGATDIDFTTVDINRRPVADANGPYSGTVGVAVSFSSFGSNDPDGFIASYRWSFGDGTTSTAANPKHTYSTSGVKTVSLTVTDNDGATDIDFTSVNIINRRPVADANGPYSGTVGVAVSFSSFGSNDPDGFIASYRWTFGDGFTSTAANPKHTYSTSGAKTVSLTVTDNDGATDIDFTTAQIIADLPPSVSVTSPSSGSTVSGTITVGASASDDVGVVSVQFFVDTVSIGTDTNSGNGWSVSWNTNGVGDGPHTLTARATDTAGQATTSAGVAITVDNLPPP
jgi:PKD repeat protein